MNNISPKKKSSRSQNNYDMDLLIEMYTKMLLIRRFEEKAGQLYGMGQIGGFCHLYIGQEAVVVGIQSAQIEGDSIVTSYRDHGHMIACDMDPRGVMAELTGRKDGYSKEKQYYKIHKLDLGLLRHHQNKLYKHYWSHYIYVKKQDLYL